MNWREWSNDDWMAVAIVTWVVIAWATGVSSSLRKIARELKRMNDR